MPPPVGKPCLPYHYKDVSAVSNRPIPPSAIPIAVPVGTPVGVIPVVVRAYRRAIRGAYHRGGISVLCPSDHRSDEREG